jgi:ApaG protein
MDQDSCTRERTSFEKVCLFWTLHCHQAMSFNTAITKGIQITVSATFRADLSQLPNGHYFFTYDISIQNTNPWKVQLLRREWHIFDSLGQRGYVTGEGVIGEQPSLDFQETFQYTSGCSLQSEIGSMRGFYTFLNTENDQYFEVEIPPFQLIHPCRLN